MSGQHTPGPWVVSDSFGPNPLGSCIKAEHDDLMIATCTGYYGRDGQIANAHLISATPDLLALANAVIEKIEDDGEPTPGAAWYAVHQAAIAARAKALGGAA